MLQFGPHDVVVLKPNKADPGSPSLGQGVVYRLKVLLCFPDNVYLAKSRVLNFTFLFLYIGCIYHCSF